VSSKTPWELQSSSWDPHLQFMVWTMCYDSKYMQL
jgi:hypothetical protein